MGFFRKEVIDFALDHQTRQAIEEQQALIAADPSNPRPYYQLALLYRMQHKQDEALGLLLESVRLDPTFAPAHVALAEIYAVRNDLAASRRHAGLAAAQGDSHAREMLERYGPA
ncbi:MAG: tetratricopeptide repeat protein [Acidobacteria bacterium]|nr:tetratricopeptide repeat protein [Acidobacteriota bacterium]